MIPRLFEKDETAFDSFGICPLIDAVSCVVTEERNGEYVLDMEYPRDGQFAEELIADRIILAIPNDTATQGEPFRISELSYDILGSIVVHAQHISYQLNHIIIGANAQDPGTRYPSKFWEVENRYLLNSSNPFSFTTDISDDSGTVYKYGCDVPTPLRTLLGGMDGSMLDLYGGEFEWNRYTVNLHSSRGSDNGVRIAYTKNLTGLTYDIDLSNVYTGVIAYYHDSNAHVESAIQHGTNAYGFEHIKVVDATEKFESAPTVSALNTWAANWLAANGGDPAVSVDVEFIPLWQTEEYKDFWALEHVALCDTVKVIYPPLNLEISAKVVKCEYNVLADRYDSIVISSIKKDLADTVFALIKGTSL